MIQEIREAVWRDQALEPSGVVTWWLLVHFTGANPELVREWRDHCCACDPEDRLTYGHWLETSADIMLDELGDDEGRTLAWRRWALRRALALHDELARLEGDGQ